MRKFEKISNLQFNRDFNKNISLYEEYTLPRRNTSFSAGYDFNLIEDVNIKAGEIVKIPTGVKVRMNNDEVLFIIIRSSLGFKYNLRLTNQVGIIDSDYYNNIDNEGHIWVSMQNEGKKDILLKRGEHFVQGIFTKYLLVDNEEKITELRHGGTGSTSKEENL